MVGLAETCNSSSSAALAGQKLANSSQINHGCLRSGCYRYLLFLGTKRAPSMADGALREVVACRPEGADLWPRVAMHEPGRASNCGADATHYRVVARGAANLSPCRSCHWQCQRPDKTNKYPDKSQLGGQTLWSTPRLDRIHARPIRLRPPPVWPAPITGALPNGDHRIVVLGMLAVMSVVDRLNITVSSSNWL